ncbi:MAG: hypothetical protein H6Q89_1044, partial [Myxococcaceae bacterium]|nr:hypothetical protein [Myxococcaceae bacterium]
FEQPTRVGSLPPTPAGRKPLQDQVTQQGPSPFDFAAALGGDAPPAPAPFDFGAPPPAPRPAPAYQAPADHGSGHDPFAAMSLGDGDATSPAAPITPQPEVPSVFGPGGGDFFAASEPPPPQQSMRPDALGLSDDGEVAADTSQRAALFDMPAREPGHAPESFSTPQAADRPMAVMPPRQPSVPASGPVVAPEQFEAVGPRRKLGGLIFNVAIASVLVALLTVIVTVYLSEGKVELASFSTERLKAAFSSPTEWAALDISNGLYDTRSGRPVFFVRGEVKNRGDKAIRAKVRAEILDGDAPIRHADVWIGTAPTPEDLYSISVADDVERLMQKLEKAAAEVMPGEKRGFLVPFYEYPPDLKGFRVRVSVIEARQGETAAR